MSQKPLAGTAFNLAALPAVLLASALAPSLAAEPAVDETAIAIQDASGQSHTLTAAEIEQLAPVKLSVSFGTEHGTRQARFEGPLLWTVLDHAGATGSGKPREQAHLAVTVRGHDGYSATLALGEVSPAFEGKQAILADRQDGQPMAPGHFRLVIPGDRAGGRSVRDVVQVAVVAVP